jgi:hypothetical protein
MGNPRQRIRNSKRRHNPPPSLQRKRREEQHPTDERARQVNCPGAGLAVRTNVLRPETCKIRFAAHGAKSITIPVSKTGPFRIDFVNGEGLRLSVSKIILCAARTARVRCKLPGGLRRLLEFFKNALQIPESKFAKASITIEV